MCEICVEVLHSGLSVLMVLLVCSGRTVTLPEELILLPVPVIVVAYSGFSTFCKISHYVMCGLPAHALDLVVFTGEDSENQY